MKEGGQITCTSKQLILSIKRAQEVYIVFSLIENQPKVYIKIANKTALINQIRMHVREKIDMPFVFQAFTHDYGRKLYIGGPLVTY